MQYQLWDQENGNLIGDFADQAHALDFVRQEIDARGPSIVNGMAMLRVGEDRHSLQLIAEGPHLLRLLRTEVAV